MKGRTLLTGLSAVILMILLILDSKTAVNSAQAGIQMCLTTVIPSLFPFLLLSGIITASFTGEKVSILRLPGRLCGIPSGCESLLLIGWLGGYPIGAQNIYQEYRNGRLERSDAERMLGFCNNAGPAFIFGITSAVFHASAIPWVLWGIQIISSLITGILLPGRSTSASHTALKKSDSISKSLIQSVKSMGIICGWILAARVVIGFCQRWFLWLLPEEVSVLLKGILELSNGCIELTAVPSETARFILCSIMLAFGGLCVWMQTISVTGDLRPKLCFRGKLLQTVISLLLSAALCPVLFPGTAINRVTLYVAAALVLTIVLLLFAKKIVAFKKKVLYNAKKHQQKGDAYAFPRKTSPLL